MQLTNRLIPFVKFILIVWLLLTPQKAFCQFSDSTIREINLRLIELHECRQKQALYEQLAVNDGNTINRQDSVIQLLIVSKNKESTLKNRYKTISALSSLMLLLAIIL